MQGTFVKSQDFVQRHVAGECLLVPVRRRLTEVNCLYVLNETGAAVWDLLDGTRSISEITARLLNEYDAAPEQIERDVGELVRDLLSIHAVHELAR